MRDVQVLQANGQEDPEKQALFNVDQIEKLEQLERVFHAINLDKTITETG